MSDAENLRNLLTAALSSNGKRLSPQEIFSRIQTVIGSTPVVPETGPITPEVLQWLGRAHALIKEVDVSIDAIKAQSAVDHVIGQFRAYGMKEMQALLHRAAAHVELQLPATSQGAFLPIGSSFDAVSIFSKVVSTATNYVRLIDPYLAENALTEFAVLIPVGVKIELLGGDTSVKPGLKPTAKAWVQQYDAQRPLSVRLATSKSLHDRVVDVDGREAWLISQSLNAIATRSPATFTKQNPDVAGAKIDWYQSVWDAATPIAE